MDKQTWIDVGSAGELKQRSLQQVMLGSTRVALVYKDDSFSAISDTCNHVGGPLGGGTMDGDYSSVRGTTGNSIAAPAKASPASRRTRCPRTKSGLKTAVS